MLSLFTSPSAPKTHDSIKRSIGSPTEFRKETKTPILRVDGVSGPDWLPETTLVSNSSMYVSLDLEVPTTTELLKPKANAPPETMYANCSGSNTFQFEYSDDNRSRSSTLSVMSPSLDGHLDSATDNRFLVANQIENEFLPRIQKYSPMNPEQEGFWGLGKSQAANSNRSSSATIQARLPENFVEEVSNNKCKDSFHNLAVRMSSYQDDSKERSVFNWKKPLEGGKLKGGHSRRGSKQMKTTSMIASKQNESSTSISSPTEAKEAPSRPYSSITSVSHSRHLSMPMFRKRATSRFSRFGLSPAPMTISPPVSNDITASLSQSTLSFDQLNPKLGKLPSRLSPEEEARYGLTEEARRELEQAASFARSMPMSLISLEDAKARSKSNTLPV